MKNLIKKTAVTTLSVVGMLSMMPSALCAPEGANNNTPPQSSGRGHIDPFNIMVVGKYLNSVYELQKLQMVNKKYEDLLERYHFNPVAIKPGEKWDLPNIETYRVGENRRDFISTFPNDNVKKLVYLPGSFIPHQFHQVIDENRVYIDKWEREFKLNSEDPMEGCSITFTKKGKTIVFMFSPSFNGDLNGVYFDKRIHNSIKCYNDILEKCGVEDAARVTLKEKLVVPSNVTRIRQFAFADCTNLKEVVIPDTVTSIEGDAFANCTNLEKITIPNSVTSIGGNAFRECRNLKEINIPSSVTSIGPFAFSDCKNLKEINIPSSVTNIETNAFENCTNLKKITIPNSVTSIGPFAFRDCENLKEINIPSSVTNIGDFAFGDCTNLKKITIPDSVTSIGNSAFENCENLTEINIPDSVTSIEYYAFSGCKNLKKITIPDSVTHIERGAFENCENLTEINIPNSVKKIGEGAFEGCLSLNHIEYNGEVYTDIGEFMDYFNVANGESCGDI